MYDLSLSSSLRKPKAKVTPNRPIAGAFKKKAATPTQFRKFYVRGDLPCCIQHRGGATLNRIQWKINLVDIDYSIYLPILFDGLREKKQPYKTLAVQGIQDFLSANKTNVLENGSEVDKVLPVIPLLVIPLKRALTTKDRKVIPVALQAIQMLLREDATGMVGEALVPYYRQLLPTMNLFKNFSHNTGDAPDFNQKNDMAQVITDTLEMMEQHGGEDAFINIKYMIPTYESCMQD